MSLAAPAAVKAALIAAFIHYDGISAHDVAGTVPGSVYYAYAPSTRLHWALAQFTPSTSAPLKVKVRFQDGAGFAILAQPAGSKWSVVNLVGAPACLLKAGLPAAVERAWNLTDSPGCAPVSRAVKLDNAASYHASFQIPADWTSTPYQGTGSSFDQDGSNGFVNVNASQGASSIRPACQAIATGNVLRPYGTAPTVSAAVVDHHPACFITPSADAPEQRIRAGGPVFASAALVVRYHALLGGNYRYLLITCDPGHLWPIAQSLRIAAGY